MPYGDPEMVSGTRSTRAEEAAASRLTKKPVDIKSVRRHAAILLAKKRGLPVYESNYSRLVVQVAAPRDFADANGRQRNLPGIRAKFNFGLYTPISSLRPGTVEHKEEIDLIIAALDSHPKMGINKLFWHAEDMENLEKETRYQEAVKLLAEDEELKSRFLAQISADELDASVLHTQKKRANAILAARGVENFKPAVKKTGEEELDELIQEEKGESAAAMARREIMERAERSRDALAQKARRSADDDLSDVLTPSPKRKKKKGKKHRRIEATAL